MNTMSNRRFDPWDYTRKNRPRYNPAKQPFDDFFATDINSLQELLNWILGDEETAMTMKHMAKSEKLKARVKRNERVYEVVITDVTPDPEEVPDEVNIEWVSDFGEGHEDLTE